MFKKFQFFEKKKEVDLNQWTVDHLHEGFQATTSTSGHDLIIIGDIYGTLYLFNAQFDCIGSWTAFTRNVTQLVMARDEPILLTLGQEEDERFYPLLKIWCLQSIESSGQVQLLNTIPLVENIGAYALACSPNVSHIAVGLVNGTLLLISGSVKQKNGAIIKNIKQEHSRPITALFFVLSLPSSHSSTPNNIQIQQSTQPSNQSTSTSISFLNPVSSMKELDLHLFIVTIESITVAKVIRDQIVAKPLILNENAGADIRCATMDQYDRLVVASNGTLSTYDHQHLLETITCSHPCSEIYSLNHYIICIIPASSGLQNPLVSTVSTKINNENESNLPLVVPPYLMMNPTSTSSFSILVYDLTHQFTVFESNFEASSQIIPFESQKAITYITRKDKNNRHVDGDDNDRGGDESNEDEDGELFYSKRSMLIIVTQDGKLCIHAEKSIKNQLNTLFNKNDYQLALKLASQVTTSQISSTITPNKDNNMKKMTSKSWIADIHRRFGDHLFSKRDYRGAMDQYLETIGLLEPGHVIRLYLDVQRIPQLMRYLLQLHECGMANRYHTTMLLNCYTKLNQVKELDEFLSRTSGKEYDLDTAIQVCRESGCYQHALSLATRTYRHELVIDLLVDTLKKYDEAMAYLDEINPREALMYLKKYGKKLVRERPQEMMACLIQSWERYADSTPIKTNSIPSPTPTLKCHGLVEIFPSDQKQEGSNVIKADSFIPVLVDQPRLLVQFLEFILGTSHSSTNLISSDPDSTASTTTTITPRQYAKWTPFFSSHLFHTLLELYLTIDWISATHRSPLVLNLIQHPLACFDEGQALLCCQLHHFIPGLIYFYDKLKLYVQVVELYLEQGDIASVLRYCKNHAQDSSLWCKVFTHWANDPSPEASKALEQALDILSTHQSVLPPIQVIQILAQSDVVSLHTIRPYIMESLSYEIEKVEENSKMLEAMREEIRQHEEKLDQLTTTAQVFQNVRCTSCHMALTDLPIVCFMCKHTYHARCLGENETECPVCAPEMHAFEMRQRALREKAQGGGTSEFYSLLEKAQGNGFDLIAKYFGRGIFDPQTTNSKDKD